MKSSNTDVQAPGKADPLRVVLTELGGAPSAASAELDQARAGEVILFFWPRLHSAPIYLTIRSGNLRSRLL